MLVRHRISENPGIQEDNYMEYTAEGFSFASAQDAKEAENERAKIEYLETHMDYDNPNSILKVYKKAIDDRVFKTPVGIMYLKELQGFLYQQTQIDQEQISDIPVYQVYVQSELEHRQKVRSRIKPGSDKKSGVLRMSVILNLALAVAMLAMFVITLNSDQPNVLNYERAVTNRYASWEQELTEREQAVREKERELQIGVD